MSPTPYQLAVANAEATRKLLAPRADKWNRDTAYDWGKPKKPEPIKKLRPDTRTSNAYRLAVASGYTYSECLARFGVKPATVRKYVSRYKLAKLRPAINAKRSPRY